MSSIKYALPLSVCIALPHLAQAEEPNETDRSLLRLLEQKPSFTRLIPAGHKIQTLTFQGGVVPGPLTWGPNPNEIAILPKGLSTERKVNCDPEETATFGGTMEGEFVESHSFTTTQGSEAAVTAELSVSWPGGSAGGSLEARISSSTARETGGGEVLRISQDWSVPLRPRRIVDVQLQLFEQKIEGQPFELDISLTGNAKVLHAPGWEWVRVSGALPKGVVIGGRETSPTSGVARNLPICRVRHGRTYHPGKIVAGNCNYTFGGVEHEARITEVLVAPSSSLNWVKRSDFEGAYGEDVVRAGDSPAIEAGQEDRDDRYDGRLLVCKAEHKGGTHPGKVVINDCMIGYGGKEIQKSRYDVLTFEASEPESFTVALADHLPPEALTFHIEGVFEGAHALTSSIVIARSQPADDLTCPPGIVPSPLTRAGPASPEVEVTRTKPTPGPVARNPGAGGGGGGPTPLPEIATEPPIDGQVFSSASLAGGTTKADLKLRQLRLRKPPLFGPDVLVVQQNLTDAGWPVLEDGYFGPYTARALRAYQRANRLRSDGVFGSATRRHMGL